MRGAIVLSIAAGLLAVACSAPRQDLTASSDAPPADEDSSSRPADGPASAGAKTSSDTPILTASEQDGICSQIESNWNLGELAGSPETAGMVVELRLFLLPDGTITAVKLLNDRPGDATFQKVAESAIRAVKISGRLKVPPGRKYSSMVLRFRPDWVQS